MKTKKWNPGKLHHSLSQEYSQRNRLFSSIAKPFTHLIKPGKRVQTFHVSLIICQHTKISLWKDFSVVVVLVGMVLLVVIIVGLQSIKIMRV